jgi:uncharacterized membrane protein
MGGEVAAVLNGVVGFVIGVFFTVGSTRIFLTATRGQPPQFGVLFSGADRFLPLLATQVLLLFAVAVGFVLLIIPGIILAFGLSMAPYLCIDQGLGPVESLQKSWEITKGQKGSLFLYALAAMLVIFVGLLALILGVLVAGPVVTAGLALIYLRLTGQPSTYDQA